MIKYFVTRDFRGTCSLLICGNAEGVHGKPKVGNPCSKGTVNTKFVDPYCKCPRMTGLFLLSAQKRSMTRNCVMHA